MSLPVVICLKISIFALAETTRFVNLSEKQSVVAENRNKKNAKKNGNSIILNGIPTFCDISNMCVLKPLSQNNSNC